MSSTSPKNEPHSTAGGQQQPVSEIAFRAQVAELTSCIERATSAICANDLVSLEETLGQQQVLCAELQGTLRAFIEEGHAHLSKGIDAEVRNAADRNRRFLLLLQRVTLHAQSLQRLYQANGKERWDADKSAVRSMGGRYV